MLLPFVWIPANNMTALATKYNTQKNNPGYSKLRDKCPVIGTWDDHDYGKNDGGIEYTEKEKAKQIFLEFMDIPSNDDVYKRQGIYNSYTFGPSGKKIKIILLDVRYFRNSSDDILGEDQWKWLESEFSTSDAQLHFIGSGSQVLPSDKPWIEKWADFPSDPQSRLFRLINKHKVPGVVLLSGDVHHSEILRSNCSEIGHPIYEVTASGMTHSLNGQFPIFGDILLHTLLSSKFRIYADSKENYGLIKIDWDKQVMDLQVYGIYGNLLASHAVTFQELQHKDGINPLINKDDCSFDPGFLQWKLIPKKIALAAGLTVVGVVGLIGLVLLRWICCNPKRKKIPAPSKGKKD